MRWLFSGIIWSFDSTQRKLYLTFDDGPSEHTVQLLDILNSKGVKACFFLSGLQIEKHPMIVERILTQGHQVANHSYLHLKGNELTRKQYLQGALDTRLLLEKYSGNVKADYFRPPYGQPTLQQFWSLNREGFEVVMFSLMPGDFDSSIDDQTCLDRLKKMTQAGDIVVLHDNLGSIGRLNRILPEYLDYCLSAGFRFDLLP